MYIYTCIINIETHIYYYYSKDYSIILKRFTQWISYMDQPVVRASKPEEGLDGVVKLTFMAAPVKRCTEGICQASCPWHVRSTWYCLAVQILHDWQNIWSDPTHDLKYGYDWQWTWSHSITSNALAAFHKNNRSNGKICFACTTGHDLGVLNYFTFRTTLRPIWTNLGPTWSQLEATLILAD